MISKRFQSNNDLWFQHPNCWISNKSKCLKFASQKVWHQFCCMLILQGHRSIISKNCRLKFFSNGSSHVQVSQVWNYQTCDNQPLLTVAHNKWHCNEHTHSQSNKLNYVRDKWKTKDWKYTLTIFTEENSLNHGIMHFKYPINYIIT